MKVACFIPIKSNSERVPGKNFRVLNQRKLYEYVIENVIAANCFDDIYVDTNSDEIRKYAEEKGINTIPRLAKLAENSANGNDLLMYHAGNTPIMTTMCRHLQRHLIYSRKQLESVLM